MTKWRRKAVYLGRTLEWGENGLGEWRTPLSATAEKEGDRSDRPEVSAELATKHLAVVPRFVHLAQDRLDLGVASVELTKTMTVPRG